MINYIAVTEIGFDVVYTYLQTEKINSDAKFIRYLKTKHKTTSMIIPQSIDTIFRNKPIYISSDIILYTLPHKQSTIRHHVNMCEIYKLNYNVARLKVDFYSGLPLCINDIKLSTFIRMHQILKLLREDLFIHR